MKTSKEITGFCRHCGKGMHRNDREGTIHNNGKYECKGTYKTVAEFFVKGNRT